MPAPKGNKNALKHGLYATRQTIELSDEERKNREKRDLLDELVYLRTIADRLAKKLEKAFNSNGYLSDRALKNLYAQLEIMDRIFTAVKTQAFLTGEVAEIEKLIDEGKFLARDRLGVTNYLTPPGTEDSTGIDP